jgi:transcriptional regulator with XRE-family HTH domain
MSERSELAQFLRARREQLRPADVGLPDSGRRRTPGLRREEVATLAGVSIDYLVRLEQGRDVRPSAEVLLALGAALRLSEDEMTHLKHLGMMGANRVLCPEVQPLLREVSPTVVRMLEAFAPMPAFVLGPANDVLASNGTWRALVEPLGLLDRSPVNLARFVFLDDRARSVYPDWAAAADEQASQLRSVSVHWGEDPEFVALVDDLHASDEFARRWAAHPVSEKRRGTKQLAHPQLGRLSFDFEVLVLPEGDQRMVTWLPADDATAVALRGAVPVSPAQLRVVGGG